MTQKFRERKDGGKNKAASKEEKYGEGRGGNGSNHPRDQNNYNECFLIACKRDWILQTS